MKSTPLSQDQVGVLKALVERIVPADDYPGAWDAGAWIFLSTLFDQFPELIYRYRKGLDSLNSQSLALTGKSFIELSDAECDNVLRHVESSRPASDEIKEVRRFFKMAIEHVMEGYYSDPSNGGNRDAISWQMIGFMVSG